MDDGLARDFVALWQSELTAMAADRELRESVAALAAFWAHSTNATLSLLDQGSKAHDPKAPRGAGAAQPAGAAAAAAAPGAGLDEIERLRRRIAELERRLATNADPGDASTR